MERVSELVASLVQLGLTALHNCAEHPWLGLTKHERLCFRELLSERRFGGILGLGHAIDVVQRVDKPVDRVAGSLELVIFQRLRPPGDRYFFGSHSGLLEPIGQIIGSVQYSGVSDISIWEPRRVNSPKAVWPV